MASDPPHQSMAGTFKSKPCFHSLFLVSIFLGSNLITLYLGVSWHSLRPASSGAHPLPLGSPSHDLIPLYLATHFNILVSQLNLTQAELQETQLELSQLKTELKASQELFKSLNGRLFNFSAAGTKNVVEDPWKSLMKAHSMSKELQEFVSSRKLPLGWSSAMASESVVSPIGHSCGLASENLVKYMDYEVGGDCPDDQGLAHYLTVHGCEPLPRRRCFAKGPPNFKEPEPLPECLWTIPYDESILWTPYGCKSFECLNERKNKKVFEDCIDCFELHGREKQRWTKHMGNLDYSIDEVLERKQGSIRIGLDIGGGSGTFAVRMRERNVTIVTTSLNLNGPFNNFIALRGVVPLFLTIAQRLPFFDNTLDIVHSMHVLSHWIPTETLEFLLFDMDRVLRPGGLLWVDHFFCIAHQLDVIYIPLIEKLGYTKLEWGVGPKRDRGPELQEVYLSALLEKPMSRN